MPATVTDSPLGIACVFSDGSAATFSLNGLPCPARPWPAISSTASPT